MGILSTEFGVPNRYTVPGTDCNSFAQRESDGSFSTTDFAKGKAKAMEFIFTFLCLGNLSVLPIM
jgi:hypothetical protein